MWATGQGGNGACEVEGAPAGVLELFDDGSLQIHKSVSAEVRWAAQTSTGKLTVVRYLKNIIYMLFVAACPLLNLNATTNIQYLTSPFYPDYHGLSTFCNWTISGSGGPITMVFDEIIVSNLHNKSEKVIYFCQSLKSKLLEGVRELTPRPTPL